MTDSNEDGFTLELTRRRALGALLTIGAGSAAAGAGTFALFSDTEESSDNTIQAGTLDLSLGSNTLSFSTNLKPGGPGTSDTVTLTNDGNISDASLDIDVSYDENDATTTADPDIDEDATAAETAKAIKVSTLSYGGASISQITGDTTLNGSSQYLSLHDLANTGQSTDETTPNNIVDLANPGQGTNFEIGFKLHENAGNKFQADGLDVTLDFVLNQQDSQ